MNGKLKINVFSCFPNSKTEKIFLTPFWQDMLKTEKVTVTFEELRNLFLDLDSECVRCKYEKKYKKNKKYRDYFNESFGGLNGE